MTQKRITYIDLAKGIGILLVVIGHSGFLSNHLLTFISSFHMPLFFILSGVLLSLTHTREQTLSAFIKKKAQTILIPYCTFSILSILFSIILDYDTLDTYLPNALLQTFSFYGISVLWFLPTLFFGEILFFFIQKKASSKICPLLYMGLCLAAIIINETFQNYGISGNSYFHLYLCYLIVVTIRSGIAVTFLAIGHYIHRFILRKNFSALTYLLSAVLFFILTLILAFKNGGVDLNNLVFGNYIWYFLAAFFGSMFIICLCNILPAWKSLMYIGKNSLIIMATHMNCRFLGICYLTGNAALTLFPQIGYAGYVMIATLCMTLLEAIAIYGINHFFPFLIGVKFHKNTNMKSPLLL